MAPQRIPLCRQACGVHGVHGSCGLDRSASRPARRAWRLMPRPAVAAGRGSGPTHALWSTPRHGGRAAFMAAAGGSGGCMPCASRQLVKHPAPARLLCRVGYAVGPSVKYLHVAVAVAVRRANQRTLTSGDVGRDVRGGGPCSLAGLLHAHSGTTPHCTTDPRVIEQQKSPLHSQPAR